MNLLDQFDSLSLEILEDYVNSEQEENLHLDFKLINKADLTHKDDKRNLAKALSGYANSDGGLIIWGIDSRKNAEGINCATNSKMIEPLRQFISRLNELTGQAVSPIVDGVVHKPIFKTIESGYAITYVPESDSGPHMAKMGEDRYYKRSGDSFYKMEHFDIEDMFGRRKHPNLKLVCRILSDPQNRNCRVVLSIENNGKGSAIAPYLSVKVEKPFAVNTYGIDGNFNHGLPKLVSAMDSRWVRFGANSNIIIHPSTSHDVTAIVGDHIEDNSNLFLEYQIASEGFRIISGEIRIPFEDLFKTDTV